MAAEGNEDRKVVVLRQRPQDAEPKVFMEEKELLPGIECGSGNRVFITELLDCHMGQIIITQDLEYKIKL